MIRALLYFALRRTMKRLYVLIHPKGGLVNGHQSTGSLAPSLAFCHSYCAAFHLGG